MAVVVVGLAKMWKGCWGCDWGLKVMSRLKSLVKAGRDV